jgi:hypothetical protein
MPKKSLLWIPGLWWIIVKILESVGLFQTAKDILDNRGAIVGAINWLIALQWLPLAIFAMAALILLLDHFGVFSRLSAKQFGVSSTSAADSEMPVNNENPKLIALDEIRLVRDDGDRMLARFHPSSDSKPTSSEVEAYAERARSVARKNDFALSFGDFSTFEQKWPAHDTLVITAERKDGGCFSNNEEEDIFMRLWERVERLKELVAKIESKT